MLFFGAFCSDFCHSCVHLTQLCLIDLTACGISTAASEAQSGRGNAHRRSGSVLVHPSTMAGPLIALLANPFSLTVLFFSTILLFAGLSMPPFQVAALDKVLAGLESVSMFYVAYPASAALGRVLLQTAPPQETAQNLALIRALRTVSLIKFQGCPSLHFERALILNHPWSDI